MTKPFQESLKDSFTHITEIHNTTLIDELRGEGVLIDSEGYFSYSFGEHKEFELCLEPLPEEGQYQMALYKNRVKLIEKLPIWTRK